mmetsp:Transcript_1883/g.5967  ORF Transcript_1883/g.5967 Transcript_1883/m.5967 type:complete len:331 (+) Transcript_1883:66-1058(+)
MDAAFKRLASSVHHFGITLPARRAGAVARSLRPVICLAAGSTSHLLLQINAPRRKHFRPAVGPHPACIPRPGLLEAQADNRQQLRQHCWGADCHGGQERLVLDHVASVQKDRLQRVPLQRREGQSQGLGAGEQLRNLARLPRLQLVAQFQLAQDVQDRERGKARQQVLVGRLEKPDQRRQRQPRVHGAGVDVSQEAVERVRTHVAHLDLQGRALLPAPEQLLEVLEAQQGAHERHPQIVALSFSSEPEGHCLPPAAACLELRGVPRVLHWYDRLVTQVEHIAKLGEEQVASSAAGHSQHTMHEPIDVALLSAARHSKDRGEMTDPQHLCA